MKKRDSEGKTVSFSTTIPEEVKDLLDRYCRKRGVRINHFVETAILEKLEDEMDSEIVADRQGEPSVPWRRHG